MGLLTDLQLEVQGIIAGVWPEIVMPGGPTPKTFWTEVQAFQTNFVGTAARALGGTPGLPAPPYCILQFGTERSDTEWGPANYATRFPAAIYYIARKGAMSQVQMRDKLADLRNFINARDAEFETFQAIERGEIDTSADSPLNSALLVDASAEFICGHVRWDPGWLVTGDA